MFETYSEVHAPPDAAAFTRPAVSYDLFKFDSLIREILNDLLFAGWRLLSDEFEHSGRIEARCFHGGPVE